MRSFCVDDLFNMIRLGGLQGRHDNPLLVFTTAQAIKEGDCYQSRLWRLDTSTGAGPEPLTSQAFDAASPVLDPQARSVAFLSMRLGDAKQIHVLPLDGGEARQLTHSQRQLDAIQQWSPDGKRLLVTARVAWAEDDRDDTGVTNGRPLVVNFLPYKLDGADPRAGFRSLLLEVDAGSGQERVLVQGDFDVVEAQWSPDGRVLAFIRGRDGRQRHRVDLWLAEADGGNARQVTDGLASLGGLSWSPDSSTLAFGGSAEEGDSMSKLWLFDCDGEALRCLDDDLQLEGNHIVWHEDCGRLATIAARRGLQEVVAIDIETGRTRRLDSGLQHASALCAAGGGLAFVAARLSCPDEVHTVGWDPAGADDAAGADAETTQAVLSRFNSEWFAARPVPRVQKRSFQVPDGEDGTEEAEAWLLLPSEGDGPFPLLVDLHGGPQSHALIDFASHVYWYELCSQGWAILAPNAVGSGSYGFEFARRLRGHWGELDLPQVLAIIDTLQDEGIATDRLACTGKSYGGFLTAWAVGHTSRFRTAVVSAPVANLQSHTGSSDTGYYVGPYSMRGEIHEVRERYNRLSPVEHCAKVVTATLLLQGADDQRCPIGQSEELFANLVRCAAAPTRMVVYPGGAHSLAASGKPSHRVDYHSRLVQWVRSCE